jgi:hypothetical protein
MPRDLAHKRMRLAVVGSDSSPPTEAARAADARRIAAARAAADHLARVFNDAGIVNLLAAVAMDQAIHAERGRGADAIDDDLPF